MNLNLQQVGESWGVMGFTPTGSQACGCALPRVCLGLLRGLGSVFSPQSSLLHFHHGARQGQDEAVVATVGRHAAHAQEAGRGGRPLHARARRVLGALRCRRQEEHLFKCLVREFVEDVFDAVKRAGYRMPLDATEPQLEPMLNDKGPEDDMAVRLSHVPPKVRVGV